MDAQCGTYLAYSANILSLATFARRPHKLPFRTVINYQAPPAVALLPFRRRLENVTVWNSLSGHLQDPAVDSEQFRRDLKTYLFAGHSKR